jgi:phosphoglucosamine mutase
VDELPKYQTKRAGIACERIKMDGVMKKTAVQLSLLGDVSTIDGIRVETGNGWVLVRPSGTEPKIRITAETRFDVDEQFRIVERIVEDAIE